jgi:hypothetical protein
MTHETLAALAGIALLLALVALGFAIFALWRTRRAVAVAHAHRRVPPGPVADDRQIDSGAPRATGERRSADLGPSARHRAPDEAGRARRRDVDDPQWQTTQLPAAADPGYPPLPAAQPVDEPEAAPPTADMRRLPPPGSITR